MPIGRGRPFGGVAGRRRERPPGSDQQLFANEVDAGGQLGYAMLDLDPGIDLEEPEPAIGIQKEFRGRGVPQLGGARDPNREIMELASLSCREAGRRRLLDELLVAPLDRAVPLAEGHDRSRRIAQQLDLDMAGGTDLTFEINRSVTERRQRFRRA